MIQVEYFNEGTLVKHFSDSGFILLQVETGLKYEDPIDVVPCRYTYIETDELIEIEEQKEFEYLNKNDNFFEDGNENLPSFEELIRDYPEMNESYIQGINSI